MRKWLLELDRILRGETTRLSGLREGRIDIPVAGLSVVILLLALIYGLCMGSFGLFRGAYLQLCASTLKVPALFFLTLLITFPSLYVFNALVGSRLSLTAVLRLLVASMAVNLAVLASLGPIVAFFSVCTTSYPFMVLLNVLVFALSGALGLVFLLQTLHRLTVALAQWVSPPSATPEVQGDVVEGELVDAEPVEEPGPLDRVSVRMLGRHVKTVFACWIFVFGLVGAQMGWVLRPFVGDPNRDFQWFRARESNFFEAVFRSLIDLFS